MTYMMLDADVAAVSPSSVYRVLKQAGLRERWNRKPSGKGKGFRQPQFAHSHWHIDIAYLNICGTFYHLISVLDGYSRTIVHWEIRESMTELDVEIMLQRAREEYPDARPRIISDNGPQFVAKRLAFGRKRKRPRTAPTVAAVDILQQISSLAKPHRLDHPTSFPRKFAEVKTTSARKRHERSMRRRRPRHSSEGRLIIESTHHSTLFPEPIRLLNSPAGYRKTSGSSF